MPTKREGRQAMAELLCSDRLTVEDQAEAVELLKIDHPPTPWERARLNAILDKAADPPADPSTVGWSRLPRKLTPELGCLSKMAEILMGAGLEAELTRVGKVLFKPFLGLSMGAVGADKGIGWMGWVSDGKRHNRSDDLFDGMDATEAWCHSIVDRKAAHQ